MAWYRDSNRLAEGRVQTEYTSGLDGRTAVSFDPISRSDGGVYRVVIENSDRIIPQLQRTVETSFNVSVIGESTSDADVLMNALESEK